MKPIIFHIALFAFLVSGLHSRKLCSQTTIPPGLEASFRWPGINEDGSVYFESVAFGLDNPAQFFSLPAYKYYKGGFFIWDKDKFEINLGIFKGLSDGKLMVLIDEQAHSMVVDSVRELQVPGNQNPVDYLSDIITREIGELSLADLGAEIFSGKKYQKFKVQAKGKTESHSFFWVDNETKKMKYFADSQGGKIDFYEIRENGPAPKGHSFSVNLPEKEMEDFHGYSVMDLRFFNQK